MKNKKGFTLIELIAVIVLLSIIATLAIVSVSSIKNKVNEKEYRNLASTIEAAAETYAEETGINKMFVQTLIDKGLVATDDETKQVYDPRNNNSLNCQIVEYKDGNAELQDIENPVCNTDILSDEAIKITYCLSSNPSCTPEALPSDNSWFKDGVILHIDTTGLVDLGDLSGATYKWTSPLAPDQVFTEATYEITEPYVDDTYQVTLMVNNKKYTTYGKVRIDKEPPKVYNLVDTDPENWSPNKTFKFELSDQESGLRGYAITFDPNNEPTTWEPVPTLGMKVTSTPIVYRKNVASMIEGQSIYVWVKDMVGNVNSTDIDTATGGAFQINNIDTKVDYLDIIATPPTEYTREVAFSGKARDDKSGLAGFYCSSSATPPSVNSSVWTSLPKNNDMQSFNCAPATNATANGVYYIHVKDAVGNTLTKSWTVTNIDRKIDSISAYNTQTAWVTSTTLSGTAQDLLSGLVGYNFTTSSSAPSSWIPVSQTNSSKTFTGQATSNGTWYFHVKDKAGNTKSYPITVKNIGQRYTKQFYLYSKTSRNLSGSQYVNGLKVVENYYSNNGSAYAYVSGNNLNYSGSNGTTYTQYYWDYCYESSRSYPARSSQYCANYYCSYGGRVSGSRCVANRGSSYTLSSNPCGPQTWKCNGSGTGWDHQSGAYPGTPCDTGYNRNGSAIYGCNAPTGSCKAGETKSICYRCYTTCYWNGDYNATCGRYATEYYCDYGDTQYNTTCYYCNRGTLNGRSECRYDCQKSYNYWEYYITVQYIAA